MRERQRLFSLWTIAGFGLAVSLGLALVFPRDSLQQRLADSERNAQADRLTAEYLKVFLKADPDNTALRLSLANQLAGLGAWRDAQAALTPLYGLTDPKWHIEADLAALSIDEQELAVLPGDAPRRQVVLTDMHEKMRSLQQRELSATVLLMLADKALAIDDRAMAFDLLRRFAISKAELPSAAYAKAAATMLSFGQYQTSAALSFRALETETAPAARRGFLLDGLRTLQAAGLLDAALEAADKYLDSVNNDAELLRFLTRLAQAANRPEAAERYVKRLLRISLHSPRPARGLPYQTPHQWRIALTSSSSEPPRLLLAADPGAAQALPFEHDSYTLGYTVFLANRNLEAALRLAQAAVRQRPDLAIWRKRLAEVSEWSGKPREALAQWQAYARLSDDSAAGDAVLRLAEGLFDIEAQTRALEQKLRTDAGNPKWLDRLLTIYELQGKPERALQILRERVLQPGAALNPSRRKQELDHFLKIASRMQDEASSLEVLAILQRDYGPDSGYAYQIAVTLYEKHQVDQAFAALSVAVDVAPPGDAVFWHAYVQIAGQLQNDAAAERGYRKLLAGDNQNEADLSNLFALLLERQPRAAARIAEFAFRRFGGMDFASGALSAFHAAGEGEQAHRFLKSLTPAQLVLLEQDPAFLSMRSTLAQAAGDLPAAMRDVRAALTLRPEDAELRAGMIWLLIAIRDSEALKQVLQHWARDAETNTVLWGPFAAAHMSINRQAAALHWFRKSGFPGDDYLWLMSYAECLDANSEPELAWRIRRKAWLDLRRPEVLAGLAPERLTEIRDRLAAAAPLFLGGDASRNLVQALLRADLKTLAAPQPATVPASTGPGLLSAITGLPQVAPAVAITDVRVLFAPAGGQRAQDDMHLSATVRELALAYAMNRNAHELARAWLASRFAAQMSRPLWGELALMLAADDRQKLDFWLDNIADWLPMVERIEAAERAGRPALAQSLAFDQMVLLPHDEELHARMTRLAVTDGPGFSIGYAAVEEAPLSITQTRLESSLRLTSGLTLMLGMTHRSQKTSNTAILPQVPSNDDEATLSLHRQTNLGTVSLSSHARRAVNDHHGLRLAFELAPTSRMSLSGYAGIHQRATETPLLRVAAMRSGFDLNANLSVSQTDYLRLGLGWQRHASQNGPVLGSGHNWTAEVGTHLRLAYPNLTLRSFLAGTSYRESGTGDPQLARFLPPGADPVRFFYMPESATTVGFGAGFGTQAESVYTRGWRPFADMSLMYNRRTGRSHSISAGIAGSLLGQDVLMLRFQKSSGTPEIPQGFQEMGINYKWFY